MALCRYIVHDLKLFLIRRMILTVCPPLGWNHLRIPTSWWTWYFVLICFLFQPDVYNQHTLFVCQESAVHNSPLSTEAAASMASTMGQPSCTLCTHCLYSGLYHEPAVTRWCPPLYTMLQLLHGNNRPSSNHPCFVYLTTWDKFYSRGGGGFW